MRLTFTPVQERQIESWAAKKGLGVAEAVHDLVLEEIQAAQPPLNPNTAAAQALEIIKNYKSGKEFKAGDVIRGMYPDHNFIYTSYPTGERKPSAILLIAGKKLASFDSMSTGGYKVDRVDKEVNVYKKI